ncbi:DUF5615 family PIN-like protein [bacterium]|nr:DUF5615 family PIN-like protein [bacterium]
MDIHVPRAIALGLRLRGVDVILAQENDAPELSDPELLNRSTSMGRALFTFDDDLLGVASDRIRQKIPFAGLIFAHPWRITIGSCVEDLELISKVYEAKNLMNCVVFLPL